MFTDDTTQNKPQRIAYESRSDYKKAKRLKLREQHVDGVISRQENEVFKNVVVWISGYTEPSQFKLRKLLAEHGGKYEWDYCPLVTHIVSMEYVSPSTARLVPADHIVKPQWILDCIDAGKLLSTVDYRLIPPQQKLALPTQSASNPTHKDASDDKGAVTTATTVNVSSSANANASEFLRQYYSQSRLHRISTKKTQLQEKVRQNEYEKGKYEYVSSVDQEEGEEEEGEEGATSNAIIFHVDMDAFFVSVHLRSHPEDIGLPIAVAHSHSDRGTSEIASASYEAREKGVKNGSFVSSAIQKCPNLKIVPYDYEGIDAVSTSLYDTCISIPGVIVEVGSVDEVLLDVTATLNLMRIGSIELAEKIRMDVFKTTNCTCSVGIGSNVLLAKLATLKAKPDGVHEILPHLAFEQLTDLSVSCLPGIGWKFQKKLAACTPPIQTVGDIRTFGLSNMQKALGAVNGKKIYDYSLCIDCRQVTSSKPRKSIGTEINWGLRFTKLEEIRTFVREMCVEVLKRAQMCKIEVENISRVVVKVKERHPDAQQETHKFLGCGWCIDKSKSSPSPFKVHSQYAYSLDSLLSTCWKMYLELDVECTDLRGFGIHFQLAGSEPSIATTTHAHTMNVNLKRSRKGKEKHEKQEKLNMSFESMHHDVKKMEYLRMELPPLSQLDQDVLDELPTQLQHTIVSGYVKGNANAQTSIGGGVDVEAMEKGRRKERNRIRIGRSNSSSNQMQLQMTLTQMVLEDGDGEDEDEEKEKEVVEECIPQPPLFQAEKLPLTSIINILTTWFHKCVPTPARASLLAAYILDLINKGRSDLAIVVLRFLNRMQSERERRMSGTDTDSTCTSSEMGMWCGASANDDDSTDSGVCILSSVVEFVQLKSVELTGHKLLLH